jgi:hypothetical protein
MTKEQKLHYRQMAELGCSLCRELGYGETPAEIHHIRRTGKRDTAPVIPLCPAHHRFSNTSIHGLGRRAFELKFGLTEEYLLERSLTLIKEKYGSRIANTNTKENKTTY